MRKKSNSNWHQTIKMTLSRYKTRFKNASANEARRGLWTLHNVSNINPYGMPVHMIPTKEYEEPPPCQLELTSNDPMDVRHIINIENMPVNIVNTFDWSNFG
eukprot:TRINITY_DN620_c0_g1_i1.p1 TRINITY_DN620_c0_g1~~TRINITY_DN620_c0_g1_i1.p1  ORF type:complete len:102 (+),score=20.20 TRINITY_DN620_c0_g1_i1:323-628(+)